MTAPTYASVLFNCDNEHKTIVSELSTLTHGGTIEHLAGALDNGCDGFAIRSDQGKLAVFQIQRTHRDADNDVTHWTFEPTNATLRASPRLTGYIVTVLND